MRKLVCLILVLVLFPVLSLAETDKSLYVGTWAEVTPESDDPTPSFTIIHLTSDNKCLFVYLHMDEDGSIRFSRTYLGSWTLYNDYAYLKTGDNTQLKTFLTTNDFLAQDLGGAYSLYGRIPIFTTNDSSYGPVSLDQLETGVIIPAGTYIIGDDIPSGSYRFDMNVSHAFVKYYSPSSQFISDTDFTLSANSKTYAKLKMEDGGKLVIDNASIILSYAKSLFK